MSHKRTREDAGFDRSAAHSARQQQRSGFAVGPQHLPDGTYRRKVQKIKKHLIEKAKTRRDYAKLKSRTEYADTPKNPLHNEQEVLDSVAANDDVEKFTPATRRISLDRTLPLAEQTQESVAAADFPKRDAKTTALARTSHLDKLRTAGGRRPLPRPRPFEKESSIADLRKQEAEERQRAREEAVQERQRKTEERDRFRRAMAKARTGGKNGQRKLGRESGVLLDRIQRNMDR